MNSTKEKIYQAFQYIIVICSVFVAVKYIREYNHNGEFASILSFIIILAYLIIRKRFLKTHTDTIEHLALTKPYVGYDFLFDPANIVLFVLMAEAYILAELFLFLTSKHSIF